MLEVLFDTQHYSVVKLETQIPVEQNGVTLYFSYGVHNKATDLIEAHDQFLPSAMEKAAVLTDHINELRIESTTAELDNVEDFPTKGELN